MEINQTSSYGATGPIPMQMEHRGKTYSVLNASYLMTATDAEPGAVDTVTTDELQRYSPDSRTPAQNRGFYDRIFTDGVLANNSATSGAYDTLIHQADCAIGNFLDGNMSEEELASQFESMLDTFINECEKAGYPHPLLSGSKWVVQSQTESFYKEMRSRILQAAVNRNDAEGKQYVSGGKDFNGDWKYYNSDYYYKTEDALSALFDGVSSYIKDRPNYEDFDLQEIVGNITRYSPDNFNSAWNSRFPLSQRYIIDEKQAPPESFKWFYQKGGSAGQMHIVTKKLYLDGQEAPKTKISHAPFDPAKDNSATTWASYRDANGKEYRVSTDFLFDIDGVDKYLVSMLLQFTGDDKIGNSFNQFLKNFEVNSGNWWRPVDIPTIDLKA